MTRAEYIIYKHKSPKAVCFTLSGYFYCGYPADTPQKQRLYRT
ncbi:hypothetical protein CUS_7230 [Ruminococcus albus 8]|uniref:Uncharacterized protein n=1 Tax=Ruminococcus albus 8 TaxID=246199 RepID=E9SDN1_RUMAL|nr:hypothetical protein CUS_7230 [Ruminococcus albus 8]